MKQSPKPLYSNKLHQLIIHMHINLLYWYHTINCMHQLIFVRNLQVYICKFPFVNKFPF
jgi:hypothetical protein